MDVASLIAAYNAQGVVTAKSFFSPDEVKAVRKEYDRYEREIAPKLNQFEVTFEPDNKTVRNLWRMEVHDPYFMQLSQSKKILDLAAAVVKGKPVLAGVETFNKPAKVGSGVPPHQDNAYFCQNPPDMFTLWIALDPATPENGPVNYVIGSHKNGVRPHTASGVKGNSFGLAEKIAPKPNELYIGLLSPGDALIHHCQTIHFSAPNTSNQSRLGLLFVYRGEHTQTDPVMKEAYEKARKAAGMI